MSLPSILKYVYNNASDESIKKGKRIFHTSGVQLLEYDTLIGTAIFRVKNDVYANHYKVTVQNFHQPENVIVRCQCPYNMGTVCRHEAAALFQMNDLIQSNFFENVQIDYKQEHTVVRMRQISEHFLRLFSNQEIMKRADELYDKKAITITEAKDETVWATVKVSREKFDVILKQNEERYFDTSCRCDESQHPLCVHKAAAFLFVLHQHGTHYFSTLRNWDTQKNKLLSLYGYTVDDDLTGKFEFSYHEGKPFLRVLDPSIKKVAINPEEAIAKQPINSANIPFKTTYKQIGIIIANDSPYFPYTNFELIAGEVDSEEKNFEKELERLPSTQYFPQNQLRDRDKVVIATLRKQHPEELVKYIKRNSPFGDLMDGISEDLKNPNAELVSQAFEFYLPRYQRLLAQLTEMPLIYFLPNGKKFNKQNIEKVQFSDKTFLAHLYVHENDSNQIVIDLQYNIEGKSYTVDQLTVLNHALIMVDHMIYAAASEATVKSIYELTSNGSLIIERNDWDEYLKNVLLPQTDRLTIDFDESLKLTVDGLDPELILYFSETEKMMVFKPAFIYNGVEKFWLDYSPSIIADKGKVIMIERNEAVEQTFLTYLRHAHENMQESRKSSSFLLPAEDALKGKWYFGFLDKLKEDGVEIKGHEGLKQLRINPNKPVTNLNITSGIDWFDAEMDVQFGEEVVKIADIKKALSRKQTYINLKDGTIGLLTDEWMEKYGLMIKMGSISKEGTLRLKQVHFSVIDGLAAEAGGDPTLLQLAEKRDKLMNYDFEAKWDDNNIPENVNATLRPYQQAGFRWMQFLLETGWGGILADDMGLGKTLQTLTFLQYNRNNNPDAKFLIVCPTSLMYNWENEIKKFTPEITYHIHHGTGRKASALPSLKENAIITSYGTLRSDIKIFGEIEFDLVVLDESQAIKNPVSQVAKATQLINAKNKLALSGTPIQNNTFDLFAQMNFLNPGMLGSMEFFRSEFATPIDKMQDAEAKAYLRKLINPFLLRRTKEQVAPDLPEKTETVLYCEMGTKQRKIYNAYRNSFRSKILGEIEEKGIERSQMSILTGLTKLRQICDSPAILNEEETFENASVKIDELVRELSENTTGHKALVFSQFLGMLHLIREELDKLNIPYVYFDGGTSSNDREKAIQEFQGNDDCKVFLISLKAGGVGLNLTAADYVYIVDPWWNPAVEQQAIDRTHRIGQTKNIFAYRMICKDTIEEKIMILQERKLGLVKDLISDDNAFLKKLTREDVEYLLS